MGPFPAFGFVGGGYGDLCLVFRDEAVDGVEDGVGAVFVYEVREGLQVCAAGSSSA